MLYSMIQNGLKTYITNTTVYDQHPTNTAASPLFTMPATNIWPLLVTNIQFAVSSPTVAGAANSAVLDFGGATKLSGGNSLLLCATYVCNTNAPTYVGVDVSFWSATPTWPALGSVPATTVTDAGNFLGTISFTNWNSMGTNIACTLPGQNIGLHAAAQSIFATVTSRGVWTNNANAKDTLKLTINQEAK
jgi:hypothetical protein